MAPPRTTSPIVLNYLTHNADRPITLDELIQETGLTRSQVSNAAGNLIACGEYPNIQRIQAGVYRWNSTSISAEAEPPVEFLVVVVKRRDDGKMLVRDVNTDTLYVMEDFEF